MTIQNAPASVPAGTGPTTNPSGLFFVPALVVLAVGGLKLGREPSQARQEA
jgi:hypothetical protein